MARTAKPQKPKPEFAPDVTQAALAKNLQPLEYMLAVMNDPYADRLRRDRMAIAAAPYCHPKISDMRLGKKDQREEAAESQHIGTPWASVELDEIRAN